MLSIESLTEFLGWATVINFGVLTLSTVLLMLMRKPVAAIHGKMFAIAEADVSLEYFRYLANYKVAFVVLSLVPYLALKAMA